MKLIDQLKAHLRGTINLDKLKKDGCEIGENFHAMDGTIIDPGHCFLIKIGDNVTLAPRVHILAHDASTKQALGYTKIGKVTIGNNVFIGASTVVLPNVKIADYTIVGAGSVVTHDLESGVYAGIPARKICEYSEWVNKKKCELADSHCFDKSYIIGNISNEKKQEMRDKLENCGGFIV